MSRPPTPFNNALFPWPVPILSIWRNAYEQQVLDVDTTAPAVASLKGAQALDENTLRLLLTLAPDLIVKGESSSP